MPDPRLVLAGVVVLGLLAVGAVTLFWIWRRKAEPALTVVFDEVRGDLVARARSVHARALQLRARAADDREAEHVFLLRHELASGPRGRPYDQKHRRGVPIHSAP